MHSKVDYLFYEFLAETFREALLNDKNTFLWMTSIVFSYQKNKSCCSFWSPTIESLSKGYRKMLVDSGLGIRQIKKYICQ